MNIDKNFKQLFTSKNTSRRGQPTKLTAFTLAEILITLGIIGVVAALTIPGLINNYKAHRLHSQFLKSYSTIQQAMKLMISDDVSMNPSDYTSTAEYAKSFSRFLNGATDCTNKTTPPCYTAPNKGNSKPYKNLQGTSTIQYYSNVPAQFAMQDGTLIMLDVQNLLVEGLTGHAPTFAVDLNGYNNPPNRWGYDVFAFVFANDELVPVGDSKSISIWSDLTKYCDKNSSYRNNGWSCAAKAKENTDYFKDLIKEFK